MVTLARTSAPAGCVDLCGQIESSFSVTGRSYRPGVGLAIVERLHADGWSVVGADRVGDGLVDDERRAACVADVATEEGNAAIVACALERVGRLDGLVCNAGVSGAGTSTTSRSTTSTGCSP